MRSKRRARAYFFFFFLFALFFSSKKKTTRLRYSSRFLSFVYHSGSQVSILSTNHTTSDAMKRIGELAVQALPVVKMRPSNQMYEPQNFMAAGSVIDALVAKVGACPDFDVQGGDQSRRCAALARLGREFAQLRLDSIPSRFRWDSHL